MGTIREHYAGYEADDGEPFVSDNSNPWTGGGWTSLINACHQELVVIDPDYKINRIKEKFGGLRYSFIASKNELNESMWAVTTKYESVSFSTCEICGQPGTLIETDTKWIKTACVVHVRAFNI